MDARAGKKFLAYPRIFLAFIEKMLQYRKLGIVDGDQEIGAQKEINLGKTEPARGPVENREMQNHEVILGPFDDFGPLIRRQAFLYVLHVKLESLLNIRQFFFSLAGDIYPKQTIVSYFICVLHKINDKYD